MAVDYSLFAAHPTLYRGTRFRSRLEATWAAFFDQLGWGWEYEPFDLHGWVPDFLLQGEGRDVLVEVKPVAFSDVTIEEKIAKAADRYHDAHLMICARQPKFDYAASVSTSCRCGNDQCCRGWGERPILLMNEKYDIVFGHGPYAGFKTGLRIGSEEVLIDEFMSRECFELWAQAKNVT